MGLREWIVGEDKNFWNNSFCKCIEICGMICSVTLMWSVFCCRVGTHFTCWCRPDKADVCGFLKEDGVLVNICWCTYVLKVTCVRTTCIEGLCYLRNFVFSRILCMNFSGLNINIK